MPGTKSEWREWAEQRRRSIDHRAASKKIVAALEAVLDKHAPTLTFLPMRGEVDLTALHHRNLFTTRTPKEGPLTVHHYGAERELHPWGFEQPSSTAAEVSSSTLRVALVPGLVFGRDGSRIGHGKGYYDQLLSSCPDVFAIGVTFDALLVDSLPTESHDVAMDGLVTESGYLTIRD